MKFKSDKKINNKDELLDDFEEFEDEIVHDLDFDLGSYEVEGEHEVEVSGSVPTTFTFRPEVSWNVNKGVNQSRLYKLYSLFFDKTSQFYLGKDVSPSAKNPLEGAHLLETVSKDQDIFLYNPNSGYQAVYDTDSVDSAGWLDGALQKRMSEISHYCATATKPATFVIPFFEMPTDFSKGVQHQILLTISFDPVTKEISPVVYDSIGRDTYSESLSSFVKGKTRSTCNEILNQTIAKAVANADPTLEANPVTRVAYNHQNRLTEGNCGSYTFRTIKEVISSTAQGTTVKIPGSGYITSDSYLTAEHVKDIEGCIKYRTIDSANIDSATSKGEAVPVKLLEFISALEAYYKVREEQPEKSRFNFIVYSKSAKLEAAAALITVLKEIASKNEISETQYAKFKAHLDCLNDSSLGELIKFHLKNNGVESLVELLIDHVKMDEFEIIESDDLFDVPDIGEKELATKDTVGLEDADILKVALDKQKQIKTELSDIRAWGAMEQPTDLLRTTQNIPTRLIK